MKERLVSIPLPEGGSERLDAIRQKLFPKPKLKQLVARYVVEGLERDERKLNKGE